MPMSPRWPVLSLATRASLPVLVAVLPLARAAGAQDSTRVVSTRVAAGGDSVDVRRGDTLWGLAAARLGSPYRWPELRDANADKIANPHWIYPGQRFRVPADHVVRDAGAELAMEASAPLPSMALRDDGRDAATDAPAALPSARAASSAVDARLVAYYGAPFVAEAGAPHGAGAVVDGVDLPPHGARAVTRRFQLLDRLILTVPSGARTAVGDSLLLVRRGPGLGTAQVLLPTGIAVVDGSAQGFVTARLTRVYDVVEAGHAVLALPPAPPSDSGARGAGASSADTRVVWIAGGAELPTLQSVVLLAAGAREGVREGDRFELVGDGRRIAGGPVLPGTRVAVVRVVRVTDRGASARVESQAQPAIAAGMLARPLTR